jgi:SIR2-like domain
LHWWRTRPEIIELGKAAIAHYILEAERESPLATAPDTGRVNIAGSNGWLGILLSIALAARTREDVTRAFENVTFINFNYDRTIEQYIYWSLQQNAGVSAGASAETVAALKIIRPYGTIGKLDWTERHEVGFGDSSIGDLFLVSRNIRTFTEQIEQPSIAAAIDQALQAARVVIFLGFGFHEQNLALFKVGSGSHRNNISRVLATSLGIDKMNYDAMRSRLHASFGLPGALLAPLTVSRLLTDLRPTIAMVSG